MAWSGPGKFSCRMPTEVSFPDRAGTHPGWYPPFVSLASCMICPQQRVDSLEREARPPNASTSALIMYFTEHLASGVLAQALLVLLSRVLKRPRRQNSHTSER